MENERNSLDNLDDYEFVTLKASHTGRFHTIIFEAFLPGVSNIVDRLHHSHDNLALPRNLDMYSLLYFAHRRITEKNQNQFG
jgi:hypothetical protein